MYDYYGRDQTCWNKCPATPMEEIIKLSKLDIPSCHAVITESFATVAKDLGLTIENCPSHPSFISLERIRASMENGVEYFGLFDNGRLIGNAALEKSGNEEGVMYLERLAVLPSFRHGGRGRRLLEYCADYAAGKGMIKVAIGIIDRHELLKNWYLRQGFMEIMKREFPHLPFTVCLMERKLPINSGDHSCSS